MAFDEITLSEVTSRSNRYIKEARLLKNKKEREEKGSFLIEGIRLAEEALASGIELSYALVSDRIVGSERGLCLIEKLKELCPIFRAEESLIDYASDTEHAQGIILVGRKRENSKDVLKGGSFYVVSDRISDPGNLGTLCRTALAVGADALVLLPGSVDYYNPKVVRASMGAVFHLPAYLAQSNEEAYTLLMAEGVGIITAVADGRTPYYEADLSIPLAWVFGSEADGVDYYWLENAQNTVYLPMNRKSESLNVAVSAGVLLYDTMRQRKKIFQN